jgi:hypothetical protein
MAATRCVHNKTFKAIGDKVQREHTDIEADSEAGR